VFHYVPLHSSPAGQCFGRTHGSLDVTDDVSDRLVRLPLWIGMTPADVTRVVNAVSLALTSETVA
jgi:dTDP-4-amino-4,6-dideoxygalactose transaminase